MKDRKDKILKNILIISFIPYVALILGGLVVAFFELGGLLQASNFWITFKNVVVIWGMLLICYPVLPICLTYQLFYLIRGFVKRKNNANKKKEDD